MLILPRLSSRLSISRTIRMYDMPTVRIRWDWPGESRLGRLAMDIASSVSVPLSAVPPEISRLVLESLISKMEWRLKHRLGDRHDQSGERSRARCPLDVNGNPRWQ